MAAARQQRPAAGAAAHALAPAQVFNSKIGELFDRRNVVSDVSGSGNNWHEHARWQGRRAGRRSHDGVTGAGRTATTSMGRGTTMPLLTACVPRWSTATPSSASCCCTRWAAAPGRASGHTCWAHWSPSFRMCSGFACVRARRAATATPTSAARARPWALDCAEPPCARARRAAAVFPGGDEHVITSPYNSVLALRELAEHADCVLPIENEALLDIVNSGKARVSAACVGVMVWLTCGSAVGICCRSGLTAMRGRAAGGLAIGGAHLTR
jgi:hypothetical protein